MTGSGGNVAEAGAVVGHLDECFAVDRADIYLNRAGAACRPARVVEQVPDRTAEQGLVAAGHDECGALEDHRDPVVQPDDVGAFTGELRQIDAADLVACIIKTLESPDKSTGTPA